MKTVNDIMNAITADRAAYFANRRTLSNAADQLATIYAETITATPKDTAAAFVAAVGYGLAVVVVASIVNRSAWDGRISSRVKSWAASVADAYDEAAAKELGLSCDRIHKAHLDQLAAALSEIEPPHDSPAEAQEATESENQTEDTTNTESGAEATQEAAEAAHNEKGADTMTNTTSPAAQMFPHLCAEVNAYEERRKAEIAHFILEGWFSSWSLKERNQPDRGLKQYSTATRWEQYQRGEISREKAVDLATRRAFREIEKSTATKRGQLEAAATAAAFNSVSISVTWAKSRTWGANPTAEVLNLGDRRTFGHASGCGYDKESTAIAEALNENPAALRVLYELGEKAINEGGDPRSVSACTGYHWGGCIGYGAGYDVLPYFEGGVGSSCFWSIFQKAGYVVRCAGSGKMFDCWTLEKGVA